MSKQQFVLDSRLPVSENQSESDPNHPKNVARKTQIISAQANADTRYDIYPPPRVDAFTDMHASPLSSLQSLSPLYLILGSISIAILCIFICLNIKNLIGRIALVGGTIFLLHYAVGKMENLTV